MSTKMECYDCSGHGYIMNGAEVPPMCETCNGTGYNLPTPKTTVDEIRHHAYMHGCKSPEEYGND